MRQGLSEVVEAWEKEGGGEKARLVPEEFALHSGRIEGVTRLAAMGACPLVIQRKERWSFSAFTVYVMGVGCLVR